MFPTKMSQEDSTNQQVGQTVTGTVVEALPNTMFRVNCLIDGGEKLVIAYLAGKMKLHRIRVLVGDSVEVLLDGFGHEKGRIIRRN
jgi:translation initiation factor IF-1